MWSFPLAFCFTSLWLIMRVSVSLMKHRWHHHPRWPRRGFVESGGLGLFREPPKEISDMAVGACLCLSHSSPPGIVAHLLSRYSRYSGTQLRCSLLQSYCLIMVGADEPLQQGPFQVCPCIKDRSGISSSKVLHKA